MNAVHDADRRIAAFLEEGTEVLPDWVLDRIRDEVDATPQRRARWLTWRATMKSNALRLGLVAAALVVLGFGLALATRPNVGTTSRPQPTPAVWSGPLRADSADMPVLPLTSDPGVGQMSWADGRDAAVPWVDVETVRWSPGGQDHWYVELGGWPPRAEDLTPGETIIEYGMVIDTNGDRVADYEVGINNDAPVAGDFRVWVTDLAAGDTVDQVGPPYGYPVEFSHPDERDRTETMNGVPITPTMTFTFLGGSSPVGNINVLPSPEWRFYVWASLTEAGEVVAWDYGPDYGWLALPAP